MSVNRASTILSDAPCIIEGLCYGIYAYSKYSHPFWAKAITKWSPPQSENDRQQSVNDFMGCILCNPNAVLWHVSIIWVLAVFTGNIVWVDTATSPNERQRSVNWESIQYQHRVNRVSTECQRFWVFHLVYSKGSATADIHNHRIGSCSEQKWSRHGHSPTLEMSVSRASTILSVAPCTIQRLCYWIYA